VCLLYEEGLCTNLYPLSVCLQMDLICWCLVSVSDLICGEGCVEILCCRSNIVVCMPLVLRARAMMDGWVYLGVSRVSRVDEGFCVGLG